MQDLHAPEGREERLLSSGRPQPTHKFPKRIAEPQSSVTTEQPGDDGPRYSGMHTLGESEGSEQSNKGNQAAESKAAAETNAFL
jgi:hypothetical protein